MNLKRNDVKKLIDEVLHSFPRQECRTCDCFHGFITQLELDMDEDVSDITNPLKISKDQMHGCLDCTPCPPAEAFSKYIRENQARMKGGSQ